MKKHLLSLTLVLAFVVGACGGGGGGGGGTPSDGYTGKTTQATVTPTNGGTFSSSTVAMSTKLLPVASSSGSNLGKPNGGGGIIQKIISMAADGLRPAIPVTGPCGGSADVSLTTNMDGTKSATITYSRYNDCTGSLTGTITLFGTKTNFTATMNLTGDDSSSSTANDYTHTYFMNVTFTGTDSLTTKTLNMTVTDMVQTIRGGDSSKMENFVLTYSMDKSTMNYSTTMGGRLFDATWGYVTVSTPVTLTGNGSGDPTAGTLRVLGVNNVGVEVQYTSTSPILYVNSAGSPDTWTPV